jgi:arginase
MTPQVIEVPSPLGLRPSGLEYAPDALRRAGLHQRIGCPDAVRIDVPPYDDVRDPETGILNPRGIAAVARDVASAVDATLDAGRFPVLLGGDCSIVLGPLLALRRRGRYGLAFLDGHADFQHPSDEPNGEVASLDLAVATGRGPDVLTDLDGLRPLVRDQDVALLGYRVLDDNDHFLDEHIRSTAITVADLAEVRKTGTGRALEKTLATVTNPDLEGFWVHLDVDVLDDALMPAVDYRHPGGLTWQEATQLLGGLLASDRARGLEVTIFNPRLDPDGSIAQRLSDLITDTVPRPRWLWRFASALASITGTEPRRGLRGLAHKRCALTRVTVMRHRRGSCCHLTSASVGRHSLPRRTEHDNLRAAIHAAAEAGRRK